MILPDFVIPSRVNQCWQHTGIDSAQHCLDPDHFQNYPYSIQYQYNNRGFRDQNWPDNLEDLQNCIWCVGDSFTVGIGSPIEHTWPWLLQKTTGIRIINVSMDGASNNWISRRSSQILTEIVPKVMIIQWSYISRREQDLDQMLDQEWFRFYNSIRDSSWPDCERQNQTQLPNWIKDEIETVHGGWRPDQLGDDARSLQHVKCTEQQDIQNTMDCINQVSEKNSQTQLVHSFIPRFVPAKFKGLIESQIHGLVVPELEMMDLARDGHHYDLVTSKNFVDKLISLLTFQDSTD